MAVRPLVVAASFLLLTLAGCSSKDAAAGAEVAIHNFSFNPATLATSEHKVTFTNHDSAAHTATSDDGLFDTDSLQQGASNTVTLTPGTYHYHCKIHPSMTGTLVIS